MGEVRCAITGRGVGPNWIERSRGKLGLACAVTVGLMAAELAGRGAGPERVVLGERAAGGEPRAGTGAGAECRFGLPASRPPKADLRKLLNRSCSGSIMGLPSPDRPSLVVLVAATGPSARTAPDGGRTVRLPAPCWVVAPLWSRSADRVFRPIGGGSAVACRRVGRRAESSSGNSTLTVGFEGKARMLLARGGVELCPSRWEDDVRAALAGRLEVLLSAVRSPRSRRVKPSNCSANVFDSLDLGNIPRPDVAGGRFWANPDETIPISPSDNRVVANLLAGMAITCAERWTAGCGRTSWLVIGRDDFQGLTNFLDMQDRRDQVD